MGRLKLGFELTLPSESKYRCMDWGGSVAGWAKKTRGDRFLESEVHGMSGKWLPNGGAPDRDSQLRVGMALAAKGRRYVSYFKFKVAPIM